MNPRPRLLITLSAPKNPVSMHQSLVRSHPENCILVPFSTRMMVDAGSETAMTRRFARFVGRKITELFYAKKESSACLTTIENNAMLDLGAKGVTGA
jgi:hypothetical protein